VFPGLYPLYLIWHRRTVTVYHLFCGFFALMILGMGVCLTERPVTRYLMGEAWLSIVMIGAMLKPEPVREESSLRSKEASANC
jgi:hypothetical protein